MIEKATEDIICHDLEDYRGVDETEGHYYIFEMAKGIVECSLPFISLLDPDQMVAFLRSSLEKIVAPGRGSKA